MARRLAALAVGWLLCECLVRLLVPAPIFYSTWFTSGVHQRDAELGFVFTPSFDGAMRHSDGVWLEPIQLNQNGMRQSAGDDDPLRAVVMLGGASMAFSFGLSSQESLHSQTSAFLDNEAKVEVVSWPGFTIEQDLLKLSRFEDDIGFSEAIVFAYSEDDFELAESLPAVGQPPNVQMRRGVVQPNDPASHLIGNLYYESVVLAGAARWIQAAREILGFASPITSESQIAPEHEPEYVDQNAERPPISKRPVAMLAAEQLRRKGFERVLVVALPHQLRFIGPESLSDYKSNEFDLIDLRRLAEDHDMDWIAGGHYGPKSAKQIASRIAEAMK